MPRRGSGWGVWFPYSYGYGPYVYDYGYDPDADYAYGDPHERGDYDDTDAGCLWRRQGAGDYDVHGVWRRARGC